LLEYLLSVSRGLLFPQLLIVPPWLACFVIKSVFEGKDIMS
jgi:hypothetical protein